MASVRVNAASDGDNTVIAAPGAGKRLAVYGFALTGQTTAGVALLRSGAAGTIHADLSLGTSGGVSLGGGPARGQDPLFVCDSNAALVCNNATGLDVRGIVTYFEVAG